MGRILCARRLAENDVTEYMARCAMRDDAPPYCVLSRFPVLFINSYITIVSNSI